MGFLTGGTAAKLGDRYEGRCCIALMLQVLAEQLRSIEIEAVGDDEKGVDLWTTTNDGRRVAHQCKAFNKSGSNWSIADLKQRGVLEKAISQLSRSNDIEFCFMSSIQATELEDLSRHATDCGGENSERFVEHFDVRQNVANCFSRVEFFARPDAGIQLLNLVRAQAYFDEDQMLTWRLNEYVATFEPFADAVIEMANVLALELKAPPTERHYRDLAAIMKLLKRLYEETAGPDRDEIRRKCLDALDVLLEASPSLGCSLAEGLQPS